MRLHVYNCRWIIYDSFSIYLHVVVMTTQLSSCCRFCCLLALKNHWIRSVDDTAIMVSMRLHQRLSDDELQVFQMSWEDPERQQSPA